LEEYLCVTLLSKPGEGQADFSGRLSRFWTHMLRNFKRDFEKVYAETSQFDTEGDRLSRQYLALASVVARLESELAGAGIDHLPVDRDETYSKYEAVAPEWMQIEH
jgi:hypothetical protein